MGIPLPPISVSPSSSAQSGSRSDSNQAGVAVGFPEAAFNVTDGGSSNTIASGGATVNLAPASSSSGPNPALVLGVIAIFGVVAWQLSKRA